MRTETHRVRTAESYGGAECVYGIYRLRIYIYIRMYGKGLRGWSFAKARRWFIVTLEEKEKERTAALYPPRNGEPRSPISHPPSPHLSSVSLPPSVTTPFCQNDVPTKPAGDHWYRVLPFVAFVTTSSPTLVLRWSRWSWKASSSVSIWCVMTILFNSRFLRFKIQDLSSLFGILILLSLYLLRLVDRERKLGFS